MNNSIRKFKIKFKGDLDSNVCVEEYHEAYDIIFDDTFGDEHLRKFTLIKEDDEKYTHSVVGVDKFYEVLELISNEWISLKSSYCHKCYTGTLSFCECKKHKNCGN